LVQVLGVVEQVETKIKKAGAHRLVINNQPRFYQVDGTRLQHQGSRDRRHFYFASIGSVVGDRASDGIAQVPLTE
jgi:hypothetical protein